MGPKTISSMIFQKCIGPDMFFWIRHCVAEVCTLPSALLLQVVNVNFCGSLKFSQYLCFASWGESSKYVLGKSHCVSASPACHVCLSPVMEEELRILERCDVIAYCILVCANQEHLILILFGLTYKLGSKKP